MLARKRQLLTWEKVLLGVLALVLMGGLVALVRQGHAQISAAELQSPNSTAVLLILLLSCAVTIWYSAYWALSRSPKRRRS